MEEWLRIGMKQVRELLLHDPEYNKILCDVIAAEEKYLKIIEKLPVEERACVDEYIALCEEMEYQRTYAAYRCGKMRKNVE